MTNLSIVQGSAADYPLQCWNRGAQSAPAFAAGDTVSAYVYPGGALAPAFAAAASWYTAGNTQNGYQRGQVLVSIAPDQSMSLEANGSYVLQVWWTSADASKTACVWRGGLSVEPASGTGARTIATYCELDDALRYAAWVRLVANSDTQQEGFYSERLQARRWLDWAILNAYRGASVGNFEYHSTMAFSFGGGVGWRRGVGPSPSMVQWLQRDMLILRPQIVEACAYRTIAIIGLGQIGVNNQYASYGAYFRDMSERVLCATTAEIDLNNDGVGEILVSLGSTNTLFT